MLSGDPYIYVHQQKWLLVSWYEFLLKLAECAAAKVGCEKWLLVSWYKFLLKLAEYLLEARRQLGCHLLRDLLSILAAL